MAVLFNRPLVLISDRGHGPLLFLWRRLLRRFFVPMRHPELHRNKRMCHCVCLCLILVFTLFCEVCGTYRGKNPQKSNPISRGRVPPRGSQPDTIKRAANGEGVPCVYEGHLETERNWYGYLANISVRTTGQLSFEFAYPADRCCQNILFYLEEQLPLMSARMNCWQREYLLRPEDDQILRLTPSFSWSGCHLAKHDGADMFVCKGGRSFSVDSLSGRLTTWYIAASNCAILQGLDLLYRLEIYGHVGECSQPLPVEGGSTTPPSIPKNPAVKASLTPREASARQPHDTEICVFQGTVNTTNAWYGFIRNLSLTSGGGFRFRFSYPYSMIVQNVILYSEDDIAGLNWELSCWDKEAIISSPMVPKQILDMSSRSEWNGCAVNHTGGSARMTCSGLKIFDAPQKVFMALSNCRSNNGLQLHYQLEVFGNADPCSGVSPLSSILPHPYRFFHAWNAHGGNPKDLMAFLPAWWHTLTTGTFAIATFIGHRVVINSASVIT